MSVRDETLPRLFCFPHAGAGASSFTSWKRALAGVAEVVPVALPGRTGRRDEARVIGAGQLLDDLCERLAPLLTPPYLFYGHSLGGLVAHALAGRLQATAATPPELVALGAVLPPHRTSPLVRAIGLPDDELLRFLVAWGTVPPEAADGAPVWRQAIPVLRDDLLLARSLSALTAPVLDTPLLALSGREDRLAPPAAMAQWSRYTAREFVQHTLPGGHLFLRGQEASELLRQRARALGWTLRLASSGR